MPAPHLQRVSLVFVVGFALIHANSAQPEPSSWTAQQRFPHDDKFLGGGGQGEHYDFRLRHEYDMYRRDMREYMPGGDPFLRPEYIFKGDYMFENFEKLNLPPYESHGRSASDPTTRHGTGISGEQGMHLLGTRGYHRQMYNRQHWLGNNPLQSTERLSESNLGLLQGKLHGKLHADDAARIKSINTHEAMRERSRGALAKTAQSSTRQSTQVRIYVRRSIS
jgi:hypothetical protein